MRSDYANLILGLRVNTWVAALIFLAGAAGFVLTFRRQRSVAIPGRAPDGGDAPARAATRRPQPPAQTAATTTPRGSTVMPNKGSRWRAVLSFVAAGAVCGVLVAGLFLPATAMAGAAVSSSIGMFDRLPDDLNLNAPPAASRVLASDGS